MSILKSLSMTDKSRQVTLSAITYFNSNVDIQINALK